MLAWTFNDDRPLKGTPVKQGHNNNVDSITREVRVKQRRDFNGESTLLLPRWNDVTISTLIRFAKSKGNSPLIQPWYLTLFQRWNNVEMPLLYQDRHYRQDDIKMPSTCFWGQTVPFRDTINVFIRHKFIRHNLFRDKDIHAAFWFCSGHFYSMTSLLFEV